MSQKGYRHTLQSIVSFPLGIIIQAKCLAHLKSNAPSTSLILTTIKLVRSPQLLQHPNNDWWQNSSQFQTKNHKTNGTGDRRLCSWFTYWLANLMPFSMDDLSSGIRISNPRFSKSLRGPNPRTSSTPFFPSLTCQYQTPINGHKITFYIIA